MILDDVEDGDWFVLFAEFAVNGSIQMWLEKQIEEIEAAIVELNPETKDVNLFHISAMQLHVKRNLLQDQLKFFNGIVEEFNKRLRSKS